ESQQGVLVRETFPNTPAYEKLLPGDIITSVNGDKVDDSQQLRRSIANIAPGEKATMTVYRENKNEKVEITLGEQPENLMAFGRQRGPRSPEAPEGQPSALESIGVALADPSPEVLQQLGVPTDLKGAIVTRVQPDSLAANEGVRQGDVITRVGRQEVSNAAQAEEQLKAADLKEGIRLYVTSRDGSRFVFLKKE